jgi:hypothetical protein
MKHTSGAREFRSLLALELTPDLSLIITLPEHLSPHAPQLSPFLTCFNTRNQTLSPFLYPKWTFAVSVTFSWAACIENRRYATHTSFLYQTASLLLSDLLFLLGRKKVMKI